MKSYVYTIEDEYLGIPLLIEGEVIDFDDLDYPDVIINEISLNRDLSGYQDKPLELWCFSDRFIGHLKDRIFQTWCNEVNHA